MPEANGYLDDSPSRFAALTESMYSPSSSRSDDGSYADTKSAHVHRPITCPSGPVMVQATRSASTWFGGISSILMLGAMLLSHVSNLSIGNGSRNFMPLRLTLMIRVETPTLPDPSVAANDRE